MERTIKKYIDTLHEFDSAWSQKTIFYQDDNHVNVITYYSHYESVEINWELIPIYVTEEDYFNVYNYIRKYIKALYDGQQNKI